MVAMQLIRSDKMHLTAQAGVITKRTKVVRHGYPRRRKFRSIVISAYACRVKSGQHGEPAGRTYRKIAICCVKYDTTGSQRREVRSFDDLVSVYWQRRGGNLVSHHQQDVWPLLVSAFHLLISVDLNAGDLNQFAVALIFRRH